MEISEKIIEASSELFQRYGIRSVSMDDIAYRLSISKKTIYQYFKDKDDIVTKAFGAYLDREKREYCDITGENSNPIDQLIKVSLCMRKDFKNINPSLLYDVKKYHPKAWQFWVGFKNDYMYQSIVQNLTKGISEGFYREEINVDLLAKLRLEEVQLAFDIRLFPPDSHSISDIQVEFFDHFLHGILSEKGTKYFNSQVKNVQE